VTATQNWVRVCATSELLPGEYRVVYDGDTPIAVFNIDGELYAIEVSTEHGFQQGAATRLFAIGRNETVVDVEPGGQRVLISVLKDAPALTHLEVLLNWQQMLEKR